MNLRDVTAAATDRILDAAPEFGPLPDPLSGAPTTDLERQLLKDAGCNLDNMTLLRWGVAVRALRAGHEAGRVSVLHRPVPARTWSNAPTPGIPAWDEDEPETTLTVEATAPGDAEVQLRIDGPDDVCLDREQAAELIEDLQARFAVIDPTGGSL